MSTPDWPQRLHQSVIDAKNKTDTKDAASWCFPGGSSQGRWHRLGDGLLLGRGEDGIASPPTMRPGWGWRDQYGVAASQASPKPQHKSLPWIALASAGRIFERPGNERMWLDSFLASQTAGGDNRTRIRSGTRGGQSAHGGSRPVQPESCNVHPWIRVSGLRVWLWACPARAARAQGHGEAVRPWRRQTCK
jgi:hypothetical protein